MLALEANEIISRVQQKDLQLEEERVKRERDERKMLRLQSGNPGLTSGELLKRLAGSEDEAKMPELKLPKEKEAKDEPKKVPTGFPAPPKRPG